MDEAISAVILGEAFEFRIGENGVEHESRVRCATGDPLEITYGFRAIVGPHANVHQYKCRWPTRNDGTDPDSVGGNDLKSGIG